MITVNEALESVRSNVTIGKSVTKKLSDCLGYFLSDSIVSPISMPPFPQSAMDGYAVSYSGHIVNYDVIGEIAAGESGAQFNLKNGEAVRIFTGAPVPKGANTVVKQEIVIKSQGSISFSQKIKENENIRCVGEQIREGEVAMEKGKELTPAAIGFLYGLGITHVNVYSKPRVTIITTGSELVKPGAKLDYGKIYESNSYMLSAALSKFGYDDHAIMSINDDYEETKDAIQEALLMSDVLILSGGISVGEYDFVGKALDELEVKPVFYKVKQKPGKPLYFGKKEDKLIFALPGNPAAAITSFYIYVLVALDQMSGNHQPGLIKKEFPLASRISFTGGRALFLKSQVKNGRIELLSHQGSGMLNSYAVSNAITFVPDYKDKLEEGDLVEVYLI